MFDRFSADAKRAMMGSRQAALRLGHDAIGAEHILLGVCENPANTACAFLRELGVDPGSVRDEIERRVEKGESARCRSRRAANASSSERCRPLWRWARTTSAPSTCWRV